MSRSQWLGLRPTFAGGLSFLLLLGAAAGAGGQELPLKRDLPGTDSIVCPEVDPAIQPTAEEIGQAVRLGSDADQALILGNQERARDLFARAAELDPTSAEMAYRYARVLESLGESGPAIRQFCRAVVLGEGQEGIADARARLEALARAREPQLPPQAREVFLEALGQADRGDFEGAEAAFGVAFSLAPEWADAVYNRGVARIRLGERELAAEDLQLYLALAPNAPDAIPVSRRIGQLQTLPATSVRPGAALGVGLLIPGMGQFYSGRALGGFTVLALAGGAVAAGFLIEREQVFCVGSVPSGGECPPERIVSRVTDQPYLIHGLATAGAVAVVGALEAFFQARKVARGAVGEVAALDGGTLRIAWPGLSSRGRRIQLDLVKVTF